MKPIVVRLLGLGSRSHRPDRRSRRLIRRLVGFAVAGAMTVALMPGAAFGAAGAPAVPLIPTTALATKAQPATVAGDWTQFRNGPTHQGYNASETTISASNVDALGVSWTGTIGSAINSSPAVADGVIYVGSNDFKLHAYAVGCASGGGSCSPLWSSVAAGGVIYSAPAVANGVVYVGSMDGKLYAYAVGCNSLGGSCSPLWTGAT